MTKARKVKGELGENDITKKPKLSIYSGTSISNKPVKFTPDSLFDSWGFPKKNRPVFHITPFTISERNELDSSQSLARSEISLWGAEKGIDISRFADLANETKKLKDNDRQIIRLNMEYSAYIAKLTSLQDKNLQSEFVRCGITKVESNCMGKFLKFKLDDFGNIDEKVFSEWMPELIEVIYYKRYAISNPKMMDSLGL